MFGLSCRPFAISAAGTMPFCRRSIDRAAGADRSPERQIGDENGVPVDARAYP